MIPLAEQLAKYASAGKPVSIGLVTHLLKLTQFTGQITLHYRGGVARELTVGKPITVTLAAQIEGATPET